MPSQTINTSDSCNKLYPYHKFSSSLKQCTIVDSEKLQYINSTFGEILFLLVRLLSYIQACKYWV